MNKIRRKSMQALMGQLEEIKVALEDLKSEEEDCRDNIPENLLGSKRYEKAEEAISNMEDAVSRLEEAICSIETSIE